MQYFQIESFLMGGSVVLGIVFVILRITGIIAWPWFLIALPFYWFPALTAIVLTIFFLGSGILDMIREIGKAARRGR
jgi:hypothetical protein